MATRPEAVAGAFQRTNCDWVLRFADRDDILRGVAGEIDEFQAAYRVRFAEEDPPDPFALLEENPSKAAAFFQTFTGATISTEMRVMIWQLLLGFEILAAHLNYQQGQPNQLIRFELNDDSGPYESANLWDFQVFRHIGLLGVDGTPILDGYYAIRR